MRYYVPYRQSTPLSDFSSLFDDMWADWGSGTCRNPAVDVYETDKDYVLEAELAGYREKDVQVRVDKHVLTLRSDKKSKDPGKHDKSLVRERNHREFERSFSLPEDVDEQGIAGSFSDGILKVTMPKKEEELPKKIEVKVRDNQ